MSIKKPFNLSDSAGFTLIELVFVILIIGIVSITALLKWFAPTVSLEYEVRRVLDDVRYAQGLSMASGQRYRWVELSATTYEVTNEVGTAVVLPSGGSLAILTSGVVFSSVSNLPAGLIAFDSQGTPYVTASYPGTALAATAGITMSNGSRTRTIQITPQTGYGALQ